MNLMLPLMWLCLLTFLLPLGGWLRLGLKSKKKPSASVFVRLVYWISLDAVSREEEDPSSAADESMITLQGLIDKTMSGSKSCTLEEYVNGDDIVPVCIGIDSESWEEEFFDILECKMKLSMVMMTVTRLNGI